MLAIPTFPFAQRPTFDTKSKLAIEPRLMVPYRKPTLSVKVDVTHPMANGLIFCAMAGSETIIGLVPTFTRKPAYSIYGLNFFRDENGTYGVFGDDSKDDTFVFEAPLKRPVSGLSKLTLAVHGLQSSHSSRCFGVGCSTYNGAYGAYFRNYPGWADLRLNVMTDSSTAEDYDLQYLTHDNKTVYCGVFSDGYQTTYFNGKQVRSTAKAGTIITNSENGYLVWNQYGGGRFYSCFAWDRALSLAEVISFSRNPYQFLIPA